MDSFLPFLFLSVFNVKLHWNTVNIIVLHMLMVIIAAVVVLVVTLIITVTAIQM